MGKYYMKTTGLSVQQGIFEQSSTAKHTVGTRMQLADGRVFYYAKAGGALVAGKLGQAAQTTANHINKAVTTAAAVGAYSFGWTPGATAITAGQYDEGYAVANDASGEGYTYKIKLIPATSASTACTVTLYDPLIEALTTSSEVTLVPNLFSSVTHSATEEATQAGVPLRDYTSAYFGWVQTWGICGILRGDTSATGSFLRPDSTAGELSAMTATNNIQITMPICGVAAAAGVDGEYNPVLLMLHP